VRGNLELEVASQAFLDALADHELSEILQIRQSVQEQDSFDEPVRVLHLVDGFVLLVILESMKSPVSEHPRMQEVLVDRGQLILQHGVQMLQDRGVALHGRDAPA